MAAGADMRDVNQLEQDVMHQCYNHSVELPICKLTFWLAVSRCLCYLHTTKAQSLAAACGAGRVGCRS